MPSLPSTGERRPGGVVAPASALELGPGRRWAAGVGSSLTAARSSDHPPHPPTAAAVLPACRFIIVVTAVVGFGMGGYASIRVSGLRREVQERHGRSLQAASNRGRRGWPAAAHQPPLPAPPLQAFIDSIQDFGVFAACYNC